MAGHSNGIYLLTQFSLPNSFRNANSPTSQLSPWTRRWSNIIVCPPLYPALSYLDALSDFLSYDACCDNSHFIGRIINPPSFVSCLPPITSSHFLSSNRVAPQLLNSLRSFLLHFNDFSIRFPLPLPPVFLPLSVKTAKLHLTR